MAAVEAVGHPEQAAQPVHHRLVRRREHGVFGVLLPRTGAAVVAADERHQPTLARRQPHPLGVGDELVAVLVVLAVAHELPDVVQQPGRLQQQPLLGLAAQLVGQLIEELEGQVAHLLHVPPVALAPLGELPEQPERIGRADLLRSRHLQQQPLAEPERAHGDRARPHPVEQLGRDRQAGQDDVRALGVESRDLAPLLGGAARQPVDELLHLGGGDAHAVHRVARGLAAPRLHHPAEAGEGAAGADDHRRRPGPPRDAALELLPDVGAQLRDLPVRGAVAWEMELGEAHRAEGQRRGELDQAVDRADQLQAPAADVSHQGALAGQSEVVGDRAVGQCRLGLRVDDAERDVELLAHAADEPGAVLRLPHGRGGDGGDALHPPPLADLAHAGQRLERALDGRVVEAACRGQSRREAGLVLELVDD